MRTDTTQRLAERRSISPQKRKGKEKKKEEIIKSLSKNILKYTLEREKQE